MNDIRWQPVQWGRPEKECAPLERDKIQSPAGRPVISICVILVSAAVIATFVEWFANVMWQQIQVPPQFFAPDGPPIHKLRYEYLVDVSSLLGGLILFLLGAFVLWWEGRRNDWNSAHTRSLILEVAAVIVLFLWPKLVNLAFILWNCDNLFDIQFATTTWPNQSAYNTDPKRNFYGGGGVILAATIFLFAYLEQRRATEQQRPSDGQISTDADSAPR